MRRQRLEQGLGPARGQVCIPMDLPVDLEASIHWARRSHVGSRIIERMIDTRNRLEGRALDTTAGAGSIPTIVDTTMIELLRPRMVTANLARIMTDMQGLFAIPRQTAAATFYMVGQGGFVTASNQTIDQVPFSPHTGGAYTTYTRQFLEETNQDAEMFVREDQSAQVGAASRPPPSTARGHWDTPRGCSRTPRSASMPWGPTAGLRPGRN